MDLVSQGNTPRDDFNHLVEYQPDSWSPEDRLKTRMLSGKPISQAKLNGKYFLSGEIKKSDNEKYHRTNQNMISKSLIVIDIDEIENKQWKYDDLVLLIEGVLKRYNYIVYPTVSHMDTEPRARLVVEPERSLNEVEYQNTVDKIKTELGIKIDDSSKTYSQHMGLPLTYKDDDLTKLKIVNIGEPYPIHKDSEIYIQKDKFTLPKVIDEFRNQTLFKYASSLHAKGLPDSEIRVEIRKANIERCKPPMAEQRLESSIFQLLDRYPKGNNLVEGEGLEEWYQVNPNTGKVRVVSGILADYLANNVPAIYSTGIFYIYKNGVYESCENEDEKNVVMNHIIKESRSMATINDVTSQWAISNNIRVSPENLNKDDYVLNLKNGLYDIRTKELKEHSPDVLSTIQLNCNYNTKATGEVFHKFIDDVVPDKANQLLLQEMIGYAITGFNNAKKVFILTGKADTGKSTLLNIVESILGHKNVSNIPLQQVGDRFNTAELFGKTLNLFADLPNTPIKEGGLFKALTGDDSVQAERKGRDPFTFYNKAKLIFSCNILPENYGDRSDAFYNRLILLPFNNSVPKDKQDRGLGKKLHKELDYILQWALVGLDRLINNNFLFTENEATRQLLDDYKIGSNSVLLFIQDCCEVGQEFSHSRRDLYTYYKEYCQENGMLPLKSYKFNNEIWESYPDVISNDKEYRLQGSRARGFQGIKFVPERYR